jgi:hypothetical protein
VLLLAKAWFLNCILFRGIDVLLPSGFIETYIYLVSILNQSIKVLLTCWSLTSNPLCLALGFYNPSLFNSTEYRDFYDRYNDFEDLGFWCLHTILYIECDTPEYELFQKSEPKLPKLSDLLHSSLLFPHIEI